jgi:hypothetical protein
MNEGGGWQGTRKNQKSEDQFRIALRSLRPPVRMAFLVSLRQSDRSTPFGSGRKKLAIEPTR